MSVLAAVAASGPGVGAWPGPAVRASSPGGPPPDVPPGGGDWLAHEAPDGRWRVRPGDGGAWRPLDGRAFGEFRGRVADAGGVMVSVQVRTEGGRRVEVRRRTVGHRLDGDRRDRPAVARRCDHWSEFSYYRAGNPVGHERLVAAHRAGPPAVAAGAPPARDGMVPAA